VISDKDLATLCGAIYAGSADAWDHFDPGADDDAVCWALKKLDGYDAVVFRGSDTFKDWIRDLRAAPIPTRLGQVHAGFYAGMEKTWAEIRAMQSQPLIVTGHSLGAARAGVLCGLAILDGTTPAARVVFGEPKPGFADLAKITDAAPGRSYRNGDHRHHDVVTDVPFSFPPFEYVHPTPIIPVTDVPTGDIFARLGLFAWHHIAHYEAATPSTAAV
jgi:hypothetical protein